MIVLTRFSAERIAINADLVARVETNPDTRVTLIDGSRYIVTEPMEEVIRLVEEHKARVLAMARALPETDGPRPVAGTRPGLAAVPALDDTPDRSTGPAPFTTDPRTR
ncbi:flagellar FlbD family protein [Isoptericola sp. NEAU-Y5]|uniref:Flagellar FlbD family protein n=1 Tax=Isoptericola luteus TaxID=2879484 RepID=A0ABS7ZJC0_9MICO|nr:flagellar FlbD family protein [Isoptericola sp. NEAU-Y5]MCA5895126.1 flagellar FlbD family protein [Isoptericola sp. NEAU-Y5]